MDIKTWSKTLLESYRFMPRVADTYDKLIKVKALNSAYDNASYCNTLNIAEYIINLSQKKINLINAKITIDKALKMLNSKDVRLLVLRFIEGKKFSTISEMTNLSLRSVFRVFNNALNSFSNALIRLKCTPQKFYNAFCDEHWIMDIYHKYEDKIITLEQEETTFEKHIKKNIMISLKKVVVC